MVRGHFSYALRVFAEMHPPLFPDYASDMFTNDMPSEQLMDLK